MESTVGVTTHETFSRDSIFNVTWYHYLMFSLLLLTMLVIFLSNSVVIVLFCCDLTLRVPTNYFVWCISVSSFCQGLVMPFLMVNVIDPEITKEAQGWCVASFTIVTFVMCVSFYLQLAIAVDRLLAITKPLHYVYLVTARKTIMVSLLILFMSIIVTVLLPLFWLDTNAQCLGGSMLNKNYIFYILYPNIIVVVFLLTACYARMFFIARSVKMQRPNCTLSPEPGLHMANNFENDMKAVKTFLLVVGFNCLTYMPASAAFYWNAYVDLSDELQVFCQVVSTLPYLNAALNPWIYAIRLQTFRSSIERLQKRWRGRHKVWPQQPNYMANQGINCGVLEDNL